MNKKEQQEVKNLIEKSSYLEGQLDTSKERLEEFEEKERSRWGSLDRLSQEREGSVRMLMDIITMLVAPEIIKERNKKRDLRDERFNL